MYVINVHRSTAADARSREVDPVTFDLVNVNQGNLFNRNTGIVTVATSGYYYMYISAGARQQMVSYVASWNMCTDTEDRCKLDTGSDLQEKVLERT